jgi:hypothetical protein
MSALISAADSPIVAKAAAGAISALVNVPAAASASLPGEKTRSTSFDDDSLTKFLLAARPDGVRNGLIPVGSIIRSSLGAASTIVGASWEAGAFSEVSATGIPLAALFVSGTSTLEVSSSSWLASPLAFWDPSDFWDPSLRSLDDPLLLLLFFPRFGMRKTNWVQKFQNYDENFECLILRVFIYLIPFESNRHSV